MGDKLTLFLAAQYVLLACVYAFERDWGRAIYFIGAVIITAGVLLMR